MAKFIPRTVPRSDGNTGNRGGYSGYRGRGRGFNNNRGGNNNRGAHRGWVRGRARGLNQSQRGRGNHSNYQKPPPVPEDKRAPVSILFPDDPRHPNFMKDPRNKSKIKRLNPVNKHDKRKDDDDDSRYDSDRSDDKRSESDFSDEGLRITVENKAGTMVADPSFYDEIEPRKKGEASKPSPGKPDTSTKERSRDRERSRSRSKSPKGKKGPKALPKKGAKESIRITVGNDRFKTGKESSAPEESPQPSGRSDPDPGKRSRSRDRSESRYRSTSRDRYPGQQRSRSRGRFKSRSRSVSKSRSSERYPSQDSRRSRSRDRFKSRSPDRYRGNRNRRRSRSRDRFSHSPDRFQSKDGFRSQSPSSDKKKVWDRESLSSISDDSLRSPSPGSHRSGQGKRKPAAEYPEKSKWEVPSEDKQAPTKGVARPKENPFMEFLNELDYKKIGGPSNDPPTESRMQRSAPWLEEAGAKGLKVGEIEEYLENKLRQAGKAQQGASAIQSLASREQNISNESDMRGPPRRQGDREQEYLDNYPKSMPHATRAKESSPFDMYDDFMGNKPKPKRLASPPPLETKPVRSILKKKAAPAPDPGMDIYNDGASISSEKSRQSQSKAPIPGLSSLDNIEDEDEFLYGGMSQSVNPASSSSALDTKQEVNLDDVYLGGYSSKTDPGWEVAQSRSPIAQETPPEKSPEKPKTESDKLSADPTIQNILKSIGFNFELSKLMQEKAQQNRKKKEDYETFGVEQGSSFMGSGIPESVEENKVEPERKVKEPRKPSTERKESYEERARRYREEQVKMYQSNPQATAPRPTDPYIDQSSQGMEYGYYDDKYAQHDFPMQQSFEGANQDSQQAVQSSNLTVIPTAESANSGASALTSLQNEYHEDDHHNYENRRWQQDQFDNSKDPQSTKTQVFDYGNTSYSKRAEYDNRRDANEPKNLFPIVRDKKRQRSPSPQQDYRDRRQRSPSQRDYRDRKQRSPSPRDYRDRRRRSPSPPQDKYSRRSRSKSPQDRSSGPGWRRTVLPPKKEPESQPTETRRIQAKPMSPKREQQSPVTTNPKPVKKVSSMGNKERKELVAEIEERTKRLKALEKELTRLRKQENELMRKKQRQKDSHKDHLLEQNTELQKEITQQIVILKRASEVNARLLAASRKKGEEDEDFMGLIQKQEEKPKPRQPSPRRSPSPEWGRRKEGGRERSPFREPSPAEKSIRYAYFDAGNHWCKQCNHVSSNVYQVFGHLQSKRHNQKLDPYDRPWMNDSSKDSEKDVKGQSIAAPFKGVEFLMSTQAFYCSLCKVFSGDMTCAEDHLKSAEHNDKYKSYVKDNPYYERRYNLDKAAGLSVLSGTTQGKEPSRDRDSDPDSDHERSRSKDSYDDRKRDADSKRGRNRRDREEDDKYRRQDKYKRKQDYEDSSYKKSKSSEDRRRESTDRSRDSESMERKQTKGVTVQKDEHESKRIIISEGKGQDSKSSFSKFAWKAPLIGKAPGYKKKPTNESAESKFSLKVGKAQVKNPHEFIVQDVEDPAKDPNYRLRKESAKKLPVYGPEPRPVDIFGSGAGKSEDGSSKDEERRTVTINPTVIADAFSGKIEDEDLSTKESNTVKEEKQQQPAEETSVEKGGDRDSEKKEKEEEATAANDDAPKA